MHAHRPRMLALLLLAVLAACPRAALAQMPARPTYLTASSFSSHPMKCPSTKPLWASYEWWWTDEAFSGQVQPLGHSVQRGCYPYNQQIARKGTWSVETLQHKNPSVLRDLQLRLRRPDWRPVTGISPWAPCTSASLRDDGAVGCSYNYWRPSMTRQLCTLAQGTVAKVHALAANDMAASRIDCSWKDEVPYDTASAPAFGNMMFGLLSNAVAYPTAVMPETLSTLRNRFIQLTATMPVVLPPASSTSKCESGYCSFSNPSIFTLETRAWTDDTQFTTVNAGPFYLIPVGGLWRMQMTTARIVEPPSATSSQPGYPVNRHLILFDEDLRNNVVGKVYRNSTGFLYKSPVLIDLAKTGLIPGWHKMTVQGKTLDTVQKGVQTGSLSVYFEVAPPCPASSSTPFLTHVLKDARGSFNFRTGSDWVEQGGTEVLTLTSSIATLSLVYLRFEFDLSFLSPNARIASASFYLFISNALTVSKDQASVPLEVWDPTLPLKQYCNATCPDGTSGITCFKCPPNAATLDPAIPCIRPACDGVKIGSGSFAGSNASTFLKITLAPSYVARFVGGAQGPMPIALAIQRQRDGINDGASFRGANSLSPSFLVMTATCSSG